MTHSRGGRLASRGSSHPGRATGRVARGGGQVLEADAVNIRNNVASAVSSPSAQKKLEWVGKPRDSFLEGIDGWTKRIFRRGDGSKCDSYWYSPNEHKFRSTTEVKSFLKILGQYNGDEEVAYQKFKDGVAAKRTSAPTSGQHCRQSGAPLGRARSGRVPQRGRVRENGNQQRRKQQPKPKGIVTDDGGDQGPVKPPSPWRNSKAKKKLAVLLKDEASWVQVCDGYHVYHADEDFRKYNLKNFENNFYALKEKIQTNKEAVEFDKL